METRYEKKCPACRRKIPAIAGKCECGHEFEQPGYNVHARDRGKLSCLPFIGFLIFASVAVYYLLPFANLLPKFSFGGPKPPGASGSLRVGMSLQEARHTMGSAGLEETTDCGDGTPCVKIIWMSEPDEERDEQSYAVFKQGTLFKAGYHNRAGASGEQFTMDESGNWSKSDIAAP